MQPVKTKKKLSRADKKQIEAAIARANCTDKKGKSAQDSIPYERMWPDGICRVSDSHYTKTIQFQDINYQLSQNEDKTAIFEGWCDFLNYFDSSIHFQLSFLNLAASEETFANSISIPPQRDAFDSIREEYTTMLQNQLARGNNGLIKTKYLTFGIDADSIKVAKPRLERIETDILNNFKRLGVAARTLDGKERLFQLHAVFHMDEQLPFQFEWDWLAPSGLSTKDFIAPSSFEFRTGKQFRMDLDVEVSRLKLMKADHQSKQYRLEDQLLKYFPEEIEKHKGFIKGFESDLEVLAAHPHPEDGFAGMEIRGDLLTDKENAGAALLDACKEVKTSDPVQIGSYRGYAMSVEFSAWKQEYTLLLKGQMTHRATLGTDPRGNLTRIDNALAQMPQRLEAAKAQLDNLYQQQAAAKEEVGKPFLYEEELRSKNARLVELDTLLNIDGKGQAHTESVVAKSTRPSVLDTLKRPVQPRSTDKKPKQHEEVR